MAVVLVVKVQMEPPVALTPGAVLAAVAVV
jgi:hypothetical protein